MGQINQTTDPESLQLPTQEELTAWRMRRRQGLHDGEIAELVGAARETVNRRIGRAARKIGRVIAACGADCDVLRTILA